MRSLRTGKRPKQNKANQNYVHILWHILCRCFMVTSLYGSFFRVIGRLWSKPTVHRWHIIQPDDLAEIGISSGCYDNVIMSAGWHTLPFLSHPDEIANFDFPHHAVVLQRLRTIDVGNQIYPILHICQLALRQTLATERIRYQAFNSNQ